MLNHAEFLQLKNPNLSHLARTLYIFFLRPEYQQGRVQIDLRTLSAQLVSYSPNFPIQPTFEQIGQALDELEEYKLLSFVGNADVLSQEKHHIDYTKQLDEAYAIDAYLHSINHPAVAGKPTFRASVEFFEKQSELKAAQTDEQTDAQQDASKDISKDTAKDAKAAQETTQENTLEASTKTSQDSAQGTTQETNQDAAQKTAQDVSNTNEDRLTADGLTAASLNTDQSPVSDLPASDTQATVLQTSNLLNANPHGSNLTSHEASSLSMGSTNGSANDSSDKSSNESTHESIHESKHKSTLESTLDTSLGSTSITANDLSSSKLNDSANGSINDSANRSINSSINRVTQDTHAQNQAASALSSIQNKLDEQKALANTNTHTPSSLWDNNSVYANDPEAEIEAILEAEEEMERQDRAMRAYIRSTSTAGAATARPKDPLYKLPFINAKLDPEVPANTHNADDYGDYDDDELDEDLKYSRFTKGNRLYYASNSQRSKFENGRPSYRSDALDASENAPWLNNQSYGFKQGLAKGYKAYNNASRVNGANGSNSFNNYSSYHTHNQASSSNHFHSSSNFNSSRSSSNYINSGNPNIPNSSNRNFVPANQPHSNATVGYIPNNNTMQVPPYSGNGKLSYGNTPNTPNTPYRAQAYGKAPQGKQPLSNQAYGNPAYGNQPYNQPSLNGNQLNMRMPAHNQGNFAPVNQAQVQGNTFGGYAHAPNPTAGNDAYAAAMYHNHNNALSNATNTMPSNAPSNIAYPQPNQVANNPAFNQAPNRTLNQAPNNFLTTPSEQNSWQNGAFNGPSNMPMYANQQGNQPNHMQGALANTNNGAWNNNLGSMQANGQYAQNNEPNNALRQVPNIAPNNAPNQALANALTQTQTSTNGQNNPNNWYGQSYTPRDTNVAVYPNQNDGYSPNLNAGINAGLSTGFNADINPNFNNAPNGVNTPNTFNQPTQNDWQSGAPYTQYPQSPQSLQNPQNSQNSQYQ